MDKQDQQAMNIELESPRQYSDINASMEEDSNYEDDNDDVTCNEAHSRIKRENNRAADLDENGDDEEEEEELDEDEEEGDDSNNRAYKSLRRSTRGDNNASVQNDGAPISTNGDDNLNENHTFVKSEPQNNPNIWTLPPNKDICTLEEIRRGQVINKTAPNECPVPGCGKKINENRIEPSPGTIASGLRTHVLFVHYANRKTTKKRKLGWTKRRGQTSPRKQVGHMKTSPSTSELGYNDFDPLSTNGSSQNSSAGLNLMSKSRTSVQTSAPGSLLNKKVKQLAAKSQALQSLQSLMQATGGQTKISPKTKPQQQQQSILDHSQPTNATQKNFNPTTSSLFSILAGLTQQQPQMNQPQPSMSRNVKTAQGTNTINISQCSRNPTNNRPVNSSLLSLLNEKISGNVATSLQTHLKKTLASDTRAKIPTSTPRQNVASPTNSSYYQANNDASFNNGTSILNSLCTGNNESRLPYDFKDTSMSLNSFIESIAAKTGSNVGSAAVTEAKKIIEKFTTSLICSSQTIADHYQAPYAGDVPQQKQEICPSDVVLAYKMMDRRG